MNKRQFALSTLAFVAALALVSCEPLRGCAVDIGYEEQAGISDYLNAGNTALFNIDFRLDEDEDGNRSKRLQIYALQSGMLSTQTQIYDNMDFSLSPSSVAVSGSSSSGLYRSGLDNDIHAVTLLPGGSDIGSPVASSDEFILRFDISSEQDIVGRVDSTFSGTNANYSCIYTYPSNTTYTITFPNSPYFTSGYSQTYTLRNGGTVSTNLRLGFTSGIPSLSRNLNWSDYVGKTLRLSIGGEGVSVTLPESTVDTDKPWDYYNNVLLPYIEQQFPDVPDLPDYLIFPDGYQEPVQPTTIPVIYPTMPGFDYALETNGAEPPTDVNYSVPEMPGKDIAVPVFDFTQINPREVMAPVAGGLRGIWELVGMVLTEYGLFPYVGLAIFAAIVWALLHLGK